MCIEVASRENPQPAHRSPFFFNGQGHKKKKTKFEFAAHCCHLVRRSGRQVGA
jgi:hypothetical protein